MSEHAWIVFDPAGRMMCNHCGTNEYLRVSALEDVLVACEWFLDAHKTCPSHSELVEQRIGEGGE